MEDTYMEGIRKPDTFTRRRVVKITMHMYASAVAR